MKITSSSGIYHTICDIASHFMLLRKRQWQFFRFPMNNYSCFEVST